MHRLSTSDFADHLKDLARLLVDAVDSGASVGFVSPFSHEAAVAWWQTRESAVADGSLQVWVAPGIAGTVSLVREAKPNARHRGEVIKLMVHRDARGQGIGRALLATAEDAAAAAGMTLLLLDTETDSAADHLYVSAGWKRYGIVPGYAADPLGSLRDCSFYYKLLG